MSLKLRNRIRSSPLLFVRGEKAVLFCLADYAREDGTGIYPGVLRIAREISYSERWVRKMLRSLEQSGILQHLGTVGGRGHTTKYAICIEALFPAPQQAAPDPPPGPPPDEPFLPDEPPQLEEVTSPLKEVEAKLQKAYQRLQERIADQQFRISRGARSPTLDGMIANTERYIAELEAERAQLTAQHEYA